MTAGPGGHGAADPAARGYLRASHADREHVVEVLKAGFVRGMLTKAELDARVGQAFASRTYAELGTVTADLPAGLAGAQPPPKPVRAKARPPVNTDVRSGIRASMVTAGCAVLVWAVFIFTGSITVFLVASGATATALVASFLTATQMLGAWVDKRSGGQSPPRPAQFGQTAKGELGSGPGRDLIRCQAHRDTRALAW